jgi:hypothetical protein
MVNTVNRVFVRLIIGFHAKKSQFLDNSREWTEFNSETEKVSRNQPVR